MTAAFEDLPFSEFLHRPAAAAERLDWVRALRAEALPWVTFLPESDIDERRTAWITYAGTGHPRETA